MMMVVLAIVDFGVTLKTNGKEVATQEYVDEKVGEGGSGFAIFRSGTEDDPQLQTVSCT